MIKFDGAKVVGFYELHNRPFMAFRIPNVWHTVFIIPSLSLSLG